MPVCKDYWFVGVTCKKCFPCLLVESHLANFAKVLIHCNKDTFYLTRSHSPQTLHHTNTQDKTKIHWKKKIVLLDGSEGKFILSELLNKNFMYKSYSLLHNNHQNHPGGSIRSLWLSEKLILSSHMDCRMLFRHANMPKSWSLHTLSYKKLIASIYM